MADAVSPKPILAFKLREGPVQSKDRLSGLHSLRGFAALVTVLFHVAYVPRPALVLPPFFDRLVPRLGLGVYLFFVLSAFVLMHAHAERGDAKG